MVRLVGPADLRETLSHGFLLTFTNGVADEEVSEELASHLLQIIPGLRRDDGQPAPAPEVQQ